MASKPSTPVEPAVDPVVSPEINAEAIEDTNLLTLVSAGEHGVVFEANRRQTAKIKDEPEVDTSKYVALGIVSPFVHEVVIQTDDGASYTITDAPGGVLVPPSVESEIIEKAAAVAVAVTPKG